MYEIKLKSLHQKIRVGAVSYLNAKPLTYGLERGVISEQIELSYAAPAVLADRLKAGDIDLGLVPVAAMPMIQGSLVVGDYCIGADGAVESVALFSDCDLAEIKEIYLDYESRTSAALLRILLKEKWMISPILKKAEPGYEDLIGGPVAGLIIGDRALRQKNKTKFKFDLSLAWQELTGLPFVFAAWISNKKLPKEFIRDFNKGNAYGLDRLEEVIEKIHFPEYDLHKYYSTDIQYELDEKKSEGMRLFLEKIGGG